MIRASNDQPLWDAKTTAAALGVSIQTIYALAAKKQLPHFRIGANGKGSLRFRKEDVEAFLERCRIGDKNGIPTRTAH
jgi:excisionase family DNA binding protein